MMKTRQRRRLLLTIAALLMATMSQAQEWTVIELPEQSSQLYQLILDRFGCDYTELPERYDLTHVKFIGTDFVWNDTNLDGRLAVESLVKKAKVIDLSEVKDNPASIAYYDEHEYYVYPGPDVLLNFVCAGNQAAEHFIYPKTLREITAPLQGFVKLKQVTWPDRVERIWYDMFSGCEALEQMTIPEGIKELPGNCFRNCTSLKQVTLPSTLKNICEYAFEYCSALESLTLPDSVETIGFRCFIYCEKLKTITLPQSITSIESEAFYYCKALPTVTLPPRIKTIGNSLFGGCDALTSIVIPDSVETIGSMAFYACPALKNVTLPAGLKIMGDAVFSCSGIEEFDMPDAVTSLGEGVFSFCDSLRRVHLSRNLTTIPASTFGESRALTEVNIPRRVTAIGNSAFAYCERLPTPQLPEGLITIGAGAFYCNTFASIDIPESVIQIGGGAFSYCTNLQKVTLHEGLLYLRENAFSECHLLKEIKLPNSLRVLDNYVFTSCKSLRSYVQPPLVNNVPNGICAQCDSLLQVTLHERVKKIGSGAFENCRSLTHVKLLEGVEEIGDYAFSECPLKEVNIPSSVRFIGNYAFNGGHYNRVVLPEGVEEVWDYAFGSYALRYADFPSTISNLGNWAFQGDLSACDSIVLRAALPPQNQGYLYNKYSTGTLYVPAMSVENYKQDEGFKESFARIKPLTGYTPQEIVIATPASTDSVWFPLVNNANLTITSTLRWTGYDEALFGGHLHVGSNINWPVNHLRYNYQVGWEGYDHLTATLINEGTLTPKSMEMNLEYSPNEWFFFTPPFDMKAADLVCNNSRVPFVLRRFDGSRRAAGDHAHVWQDVSTDATLHAGEGYILQYGYEQCQTGYNEWRPKSEDVAFHLTAALPLNLPALSSDPVTIPLTDYKGEFPHNEGWNLVGNPYMAYFDISHLESDAPIALATQSPYRSFEVFSPLDDELVLSPLKSFFIQRSEQLAAITFNPSGRQHDKEIRHDNENNARSLRRAALRQQRVVLNAVLQRSSEQGDSLLTRTRIVLTPRATEGYDRGQDAPLITMDNNATTFYSRTNGLRYSLNELPPTTTHVELGMQLQEAGTYTLAFTTKGSLAAERLWLIDKETGSQTDVLSDSYTFTVDEPCTLNNRFVLLIGDGFTSVERVEVSPQQDNLLYDLQGRRVVTPSHGIYIQSGKKFIK